MSQKTLRGLLFSLASATCFGLIPFFTIPLYKDGISPITLLFFRFLIASFYFSVTAFFSKRSFGIKRQSVPKVVLLGIFGFALQAFCFFSSIGMISGSLATALLYLYPAIVVIITFFIDRKIKFSKLVALFLALLGTYLAISPTIRILGKTAVIGVLFAIAAATITASYVVAGERLLKHEKPVPALSIMTGSAAMVYFLLATSQGFTLPSTSASWCFLICVGIICTAVSIGFQFQGIKLIGASNTAILSTFEPVVTLSVEVLFMGGILMQGNVIGMILILLAGIVLVKN